MADQKCCCSMDSVRSWVGVALFVTLLIAGFFLLSQTRNTLRQYGYIGKTPDMINTMAFSGEGKVEVTPDIALVNMGYMVEKKKIADAQADSSKVMNDFISKVKEMGVATKDIKTKNYNISPQYDWSKEGRQSLRGYQLSQNVELKIRDLDKVGDILALAGDFGLNQVNDLTFDVDKKDEAMKQAREEAIQKAKEQAEGVAKSLGVNLGRIVSYNENNYQPPVIYNGYRAMKVMAPDEAQSAPMVSEGIAEIKMSVNVVYELQ